MAQRAIDKLIRGALRYRTTGLSRQFKEEMTRMQGAPKLARNQALFVTCMDARLHPGWFTQTGSSYATYRIRNPGNMVPNQEIQQKTEANLDNPDSGTNTIISTELAGLELVVAHGRGQHVIVCGHSDCAAIAGLYGIIDQPFNPSPVAACLHHYGSPTLQKWKEFQKAPTQPLKFCSDVPHQEFEAIIDPESKWGPKDQLSQLNVLQQMENITSHDCLKETLTTDDSAKRACLHGMWFEIETAEVWMFDKQNKTFKLLDEALADYVLTKLCA